MYSLFKYPWQIDAIAAIILFIFLVYAYWYLYMRDGGQAKKRRIKLAHTVKFRISIVLVYFCGAIVLAFAVGVVIFLFLGLFEEFRLK